MNIELSTKKIGVNEPIFIIAEIGVNHNGNIELAHKMIDEAVLAGADAVKFQTFITDELVSATAPLAGHHVQNVKEAISHYDLLKKLELPFSAFKELKEHCEEKKVVFISTPYDVPSAELLLEIKTEIIKIASSEMLNFPLLDTVRTANVPVMLSTGMSTWEEIVEAVDFLKDYTNKICILKCTSNYPASPKSTNLRGITNIKETFPHLMVGFSDHTEGYEVSLASVGMGVSVLERHFTLDKSLWGPDHKASMIPEEFQLFVAAIRKAEQALGNKKWEIQAEEKAQRLTMQKGVYARCDMEKGTCLDISSVRFLRPKGAVTPKDFWIKLKGKPLREKIKKGQEIHMDAII